MESIVLGLRQAMSLLLASIWVLSFSTSALGQSATSSVQGTVLDPQKRVVTEATVSLTNAERNFLRTQKSNASARYLFTAVSPGVYGIQAEAPGFKKLSIEEVRALVDTPSVVDLKLELGEISESVTVTAEGAETRINTQDATIGNNFDTSQISQFSLESRNVATSEAGIDGVAVGPSGAICVTRNTDLSRIEIHR